MSTIPQSSPQPTAGNSGTPEGKPWSVLVVLFLVPFLLIVVPVLLKSC